MMTEALIVEVPAAAVEADANAQAVVELTSLELALVGGGAANVCFL